MANRNWPVPQNSIEHKKLVLRACKEAEKVLPIFEKEKPSDKRPREALSVARDWVKTGVFSMKVIRGASLGAHAAARSVPEGPARFAARACGQAVAVVHVAGHYGAVEWYIGKIKKLK